MQLHFSIRNLKRPVTISVILASCSCHELEYPFTLALFKVEMGSLTVDAAQDFNAPSWSPTENIIIDFFVAVQHNKIYQPDIKNLSEKQLFKRLSLLFRSQCSQKIISNQTKYNLVLS